MFSLIQRQYGHLDHIEAVVNEDLSNCWQCANCVNKGYIFKADSDAKSSLSGSFSLNTSFSSFRNEDSPPNLEIMGPAPKIQAKKRHRRTKLEMLNSKKLEQERLARGAHKALNDSIISVSSLSSHEKEIILSEFCENIYREQEWVKVQLNGWFFRFLFNTSICKVGTLSVKNIISQNTFEKLIQNWKMCRFVESFNH